MNNMYKNKLFLIVLTIFAIALGTQSCSDNEPEYVKVTGITVTPENTVLLINDTVTLVANVFPRLATDKSVTWNSDNTSVATVDDNGVVKALAEGVANVSVTSVDNSEKTKICVVTVVATFSVSLNTSSLSIPTEAVSTLKATITPDNISQEVTWTSNNPDVVTVDGGVITAVATGTATITATSVVDASRTAECTVTVVDMSSTDQSLVGVWTFEDATSLVNAMTGVNLEANGAFTSIDGPNGTKAVATGENAYFKIIHNIGANGGGEYTNEYTLMLDIYCSTAKLDGASAGEGWLSVFESSDGGLLWIDGPNGGVIGYASLGGYSSTGVNPDTWHRIVIASKLGDSFKVYLDGAPVFTAAQNTDIDGELSLHTDRVFIGYDNWGYPGPDFAEVRMWKIQLTDEEAAALGSPLTMLALP
jgi:uncharacterized protein YjdB